MTNDEFQKLVLEQLQSINSEVKDVKQRVGNFEHGQQELKKEMGSLSNRVGNLEAGQQRIESRLENEVIDKIRALFDAREVQNDVNAKILDKLEDIEINTNYLVAKVSQLKKIAK